MELLSICQTGSVELYWQSFEQLIYHIRLYDSSISETLLVTQFLLGLREDIHSVVELHLPATFAHAAQLASLQEAVIERTKHHHGRILSYSKPAAQSKPIYGALNSCMSFAKLMVCVLSVGTNSHLDTNVSSQSLKLMRLLLISVLIGFLMRCLIRW